jgi:hypothetical protein
VVGVGAGQGLGAPSPADSAKAASPSSSPAARAKARGELGPTSGQRGQRQPARRGQFLAVRRGQGGPARDSQCIAREFGPQGVRVGHVIVDGGIEGERLLSHRPQLRGCDPRPGDRGSHAFGRSSGADAVLDRCGSKPIVRRLGVWSLGRGGGPRSHRGAGTLAKGLACPFRLHLRRGAPWAHRRQGA